MREEFVDSGNDRGPYGGQQDHPVEDENGVHDALRIAAIGLAVRQCVEEFCVRLRRW